MLNSAEFYGADRINEKIIGKHAGSAMQVSLKVGAVGDLNTGHIELTAAADHLRATVDESLKLLGRDYIDVVIQARQDPETPIEEVMKVFKELVEAGAHAQMQCRPASDDKSAHRRDPVGLGSPRFRKVGGGGANRLFRLCTRQCAGFVHACVRSRQSHAAIRVAGKVKYVGLSEAGPTIIRKAHAIHPLTLVEQEWSLWSRDIEEAIVPVCKELGIGILAYSPLGRGFLTGAIDKAAFNKLAKNDFRVVGMPRTQVRRVSAWLRTGVSGSISFRLRRVGASARRCRVRRC